ncbi:preprotein translocase subunit SecD [Maioricimonas rarisocia]|uniref:Preprotein translocase subunit SecD n=1 Tax=Maioricimonas rarisocia TaxID=2528026 RepID=A0A517Z4H6_9PLAN|nr:hypothetical protein [Maioricimonas rarisocia]QDU37369.1 preprotein translocase subunit SecD [Maioricimonas rarisocia]
MKTLFAAMLSLVAALAADGFVQADDAEKPEKVILELRLAEEKPAKGLIEKTLRDGSKTVYLHAEPAITKKHFENVRRHRSRHAPELNPHSLEFTLTDEGGKLLARMTEGHFGRPMAVLLNGEVVAAPIVRARIGKECVITGGLRPEEISEIVDAFSSQ